MDRSHNCGKVIRRDTTERVLADSYIVMMKKGANMSEMVRNYLAMLMHARSWHNII